MKELEISDFLDQDPETQQKASLALYDSDNFGDLLGNAKAAAALRSSVRAENKSASAILLLGYDSSQEAVALLKEIQRNFSDQMTKLRPWTAVVPLSLVIDVSLSRLGDSSARLALLEEIGHASFETLSFLLDVLREIDDPTVLHAISRALDDERPVRGGIPSGGAPGRRLADVAVDAFVERLGLAVGFHLEPSRAYSDSNIKEVKRLMTQDIPS